MTEPITILYVSNTSKPWCTEVAVAASLRALGHTVITLQENELDWTTVPARAETESAHMLLWTRTWPAVMEVVAPEMQRLRDAGVRTVSWHLDRFWGLDREHQVDDQPFFQCCDLLVTPDDSPRWAEHGIQHLWQPPGVYDAECGPVAPNRRAWPHDVVFVGSFPYPHPEWADYRAALIAAFRREFGARFKVLPRRGHPIRGRQLQELYATVPVILGDSCLAGESHRYWSDRIPESLGRGGLLIHPEITGPEVDPLRVDVGERGEWYDSHDYAADAPGDLLTYRLGDLDAAVDHARTAIAHPDMADAKRAAGRAKVLGRDTYRHRMEALLAHVEAEFGWRDTGTRLEVGSGRFPTPGFTHLDLNPAAPGVDIVGPAFPLDMPDGSVGSMRCVDVLEHLSYRDTAAALAEWARVLAPGGRLYVQVPDADTIMRCYVETPEVLLDRLPPELPQTALAGAAWRLLGGHADGEQSIEGDDWRLNAHYAMFDQGSLIEALVAAGFGIDSIETNEHPNLCCWAVRR